MEITVAESAGFCFGVNRAVSDVLDLISKPKTDTHVYTLGPLIHNPNMIKKLEASNVKVISEADLEGIFESTCEKNKSVIIIRTHGIEKKISEMLEKYSSENPFFEVRDLTCPYVKKIHEIVRNHSNMPLIVIGDINHPEVIGIRSYSESSSEVFRDDSELSEYLKCIDNHEKQLLVVAQTTQDMSMWKKCQKNIQKVCTNAIIFDTICIVTEKRQSEVDALSKQSDALIVIGGKNSSNTNKLYQIAKKNLDKTYFVENVEDLDNIDFTDCEKVSITAGASTPSDIILEVKNKMSEIETKAGINEEVVSENQMIKDKSSVSAEDNALSEEDFAGMLEESLKSINTGETVHGVISAISNNELRVDIGAKFTGIIPSSEVSDDANIKLEEMFKIGDEIDAIVGKVSDRDGVAMLSKKRADNIIKWAKVREAYKNNETLEGVVASAIKGGVILRADSMDLFVPASQTGVNKGGDLSSIVGMTKKARIIDIDEARKRAVASIRVVEREERKEKEALVWDSIEVGKRYDGVVRSIASYGVFVDIGGVDGMVHSSELSWRYVKNPAEIVSEGDRLNVYVIDFDREKRRISLGYKTEESNPWNIFSSKYALGDVAEVTVRNLLPFGAFAEIVPGVDGLIHISQIANRRIAQPAEVLEIGQKVEAKIVEIDAENHKVGLSIRALLADETAEEEAVVEE